MHNCQILLSFDLIIEIEKMTSLISSIIVTYLDELRQ